MKPRLSIVRTIWKKELSETLRDRRTLFVMIVLPVLLYPLLLMAFTRIAESESAATRARASIIAVWGTVPPDLQRQLQSRNTLILRPWLGAPDHFRDELSTGRLTKPAARVAESAGQKQRDPDTAPELDDLPNPVLDSARDAVDRRQVDAVLVVWNPVALSVYFDSVREESSVAGARVERALNAYEEMLQARPVDIAKRDVAPPPRRAGRLLGRVLPLFLLMLCIGGGLYPAIDLTAGEKERGTMQTLMCAPVLPVEIIWGKFLAVWTLTLASALANVVSLATTLTRVLPVGGNALPVSLYALTATMLVPVTLLTSALFLAVAVFAKDFKEGQSFLTPVYMALALPSMVTMLPTIELNAWTTFVPIVNIALLIKAVLVREARPELVFFALLSSGVYATLGLALAVRVLQREQILLGAREPVREIIGLHSLRSRVPSAGLALLLFAVSLVLAFYGSLLLESRGIITTVLVTQVGFFLLPAALAAGVLRLDVHATFSLRPPRPGQILAAAVVGLSAWTFASGVLLRIAPPPDTLVKALERILMVGDEPMPFWIIWLVIALAPAICEELLFRGFILSGFRTLGAAPAIGASALLFGVAHASIYRLLPTFFLGLLLGIVVWRTGSIFCSIIIHAINNGLLATLTASPELARTIGLSDQAESLPWTPTIVGSVLACAALWLIFILSDGGTGLVRNRTDANQRPPDADATKR
jgi:sodium transport system permease protein